MAKRPTLADVARRTGLSTATVSMALNAPPGSRIPETTAARVRAAAAELGYVADPNARSLRTGRTGAIGFISDEVTVTRFATAMVRGLLDAAEERDHVVMIMETDHRPDRIARAFDIMRSRRIDGVAVGLMAARAIELPPPMGSVPRVVINGVAEGCLSVLPDEFTAGHTAARYLLDRGHRRIGLVGRHPVRPEPPVSATIGIRMDGIDHAMREAGLTFAAEHHGAAWEPELGFRGANAVLDRAPDLTAVLAANDRIAFGVYQALQERGLSVPGDVSVMSFDDEQLAAMVRPPLTTMRLPYREMGHVGATYLLDALTGTNPPEPGSMLMPLELVERTSVKTI